MPTRGLARRGSEGLRSHAMRRAAFVLLTLLCWGVAAYGLAFYAVSLPAPGRMHPEMLAVFESHTAGIRTHVVGASVALLLGPWQFSRHLRTLRPALHRWVGRVYLGVGVGIGGLAGLYMAGMAYGGLVSQAGFSLLALAWLYTGWRAYAAARHRDIAVHRRWIIVNFALTCAAVTLRIQLGLAGVHQWPFELAYPVIAWACWVPNLLVAAWLLRRG